MPLLIQFREFLECERVRVLPRNPEGMAIACTLSNWETIGRYTCEGNLDIDNNGAELGRDCDRTPRPGVSRQRRRR